MNTLEGNQAVKGNLAVRILKEKCPHCGKGDVYEKKQKLFELPVMKDRCGACNYFFDREPGYFLGAMYISYGLAVLQGIVTFILLYTFLPDIPTIWVVLMVEPGRLCYGALTSKNPHPPRPPALCSPEPCHPRESRSLA